MSIKNTVEEPVIEDTGKTLYGIYDNESGVLVDLYDQEVGDFGYDYTILASNPVNVISFLSTRKDKKALFDGVEFASVIKDKLQAHFPNNSYSLVRFSEKIFRYYEFDFIE